MTAQTDRLAAEQVYIPECAALHLSLGQPTDSEFGLKPAATFPEPPFDTSAATLLQDLEHRRR